MSKGKHHKRSKISAPRVLGGMLLGYAATAILTFDLLSPTVTAPLAQAILPNRQQSSPDSPGLADLTLATDDPPTTEEIPVTPVAEAAPTTSATSPPSTTSKPPPTTTRKSIPTTTPPARPKPPADIIKPAVPPVGGASFRTRFFSIAQTYVGRRIPYLFGGKLLSGLDCSGFVWDVIKQIDPKQPYRNSTALKAWTTPIPLSQAQPGDLMFWLGHVAIYAGNGKVISQGGPGPGPILTAIWPGYTVGRIPL